jgi:hypothetical protein
MQQHPSVCGSVSHIGGDGWIIEQEATTPKSSAQVMLQPTKELELWAGEGIT